MINVVAVVTLVAAVILSVVGSVLLLQESKIKRDVATSSKNAVDGKVSEANTVQEQGAVSGVVDSVAKLASALAGLSSGTQALTISVALYGISALAAGVDTVATAIVQ